MANTIEQITNSLLIKNNIRGFDRKDLELQLQIHPNYPSFQSVTDTLDYFTIENIAVEVPKDALDQLPKTFVTILDHNDKTEIALINKSDTKITIKHATITQSILSYEAFKKIWIPKIIAVEEGESGQKSSNQTLVLKQVLLSTASIVVLIQAYLSNIQLIDIFTLLLFFTGGVLSFFAVRESLGYKSQALQSFCTTIKQSNCNEVITSKKGELISGVTFADAGMVFFTTLSTYAILFGIDNILMIPCLIGIPFILYSLYSQQFVIKQWCVLCLGISTITLLICASLFLNHPFQFIPSNIIKLTLLSSSIALTYMYLKTYISENRTLKTKNIKLLKFKRNQELFEQLLNKSTTIERHTFENEIVLGNPDAEFTIISLTNPLCGFCRAAFEGYTRVLKTLGSTIKIIIRMPINTEKQDAPAYKIALRLLEIFEKDGQKGFINAYSNWFENRAVEDWLKIYGEPEQKVQHTELLNAHKDWASQNNLNYTPATIINEKIYPKVYDYEELFFFTQHLIEKFDDQTLETREVAIKI